VDDFVVVFTPKTLLKGLDVDEVDDEFFIFKTTSLEVLPLPSFRILVA